MGLSSEERRRYARHLSLTEIGELGQERLSSARFRLPQGAHPHAVDVARDYLTRAGMHEAPDPNDPGATEVPVPGPDQVVEQAGGSAAMESPVAAFLGALAAVETVKGVLGVGTPASVDPPSPGSTE